MFLKDEQTEGKALSYRTELTIVLIRNVNDWRNWRISRGEGSRVFTEA